MDSEYVQACNEIEAAIHRKLREALTLWEQYVKIYALDDPSTAFDLVGDPPAWVTSVREHLGVPVLHAPSQPTKFVAS